MPCSICSCNFIPKSNKTCPGCIHSPCNHNDLYTRKTLTLIGPKANCSESELNNMRGSLGPETIITKLNYPGYYQIIVTRVVSSVVPVNELLSNDDTHVGQVNLPESQQKNFIENLSLSLQDINSHYGLSSIKSYENKLISHNCCSIFSKIIINDESELIENENFINKLARYNEIKKSKYSSKVYAYGPNYDKEHVVQPNISVYQHNQLYNCPECNMTLKTVKELKEKHIERINKLFSEYKLAISLQVKPNQSNNNYYGYNYNPMADSYEFEYDHSTCHICNFFVCYEHNYFDSHISPDVKISRCITCYRYTCSNCFILAHERPLMKFGCTACNAKAQFDREFLRQCFACAENAKPCSCLGIDCWPCKNHGEVKICDSIYHSVTCPKCGGTFCRDCENIPNHIIWQCDNASCPNRYIRCSPDNIYESDIMKIESAENILNNLINESSYDNQTDSRKIIIPSNSFFASLRQNQHNKCSSYCNDCEKLIKFQLVESLIPLNVSNVLINIIFNYCNISGNSDNPSKPASTDNNSINNSTNNSNTNTNE